MFDYKEQIPPAGEWNIDTIYLYFLIIVVSTFFALLSEKKYRLNKVVINYKLTHHFFLGLSFLVLFFFSAFRDVGKDIDAYKEIFHSLNSFSVSELAFIEPGYLLLNKIVRLISADNQSIIIAMSFLSLFFTYRSLDKISSQLSIGLSIFVFVSLSYFQSFNLSRIYLAASLILFGTLYLLQNKNIRFILITIIAISIHYSSIVILFTFGMYKIYQKNQYIFYIIMLFLFFLLFYTSSFIDSLFFVKRYSESYGDNDVNSGSIGFLQFVYHIPIFLFSLYVTSKKIIHSNINQILWVYAVISLFFGMLAYKIDIAGRLSIHFFIIFILFIPLILNELKNIKDKNYNIIKLALILYIIFRTNMYFKEYLYLDAIMPYKTIF